MAENKLTWQSKLVLLAVLPFAGTEVVLDCNWWASHAAPVAIWTIGISILLGLVTWRLRAATPAAALTGVLITASLMFSTVVVPYEPWHTALVPTLAVSLLAFVATLAGRRQKEQLGTAEGRKGRSASQVAANLGFAALVVSTPVQSWLLDSHWVPRHAAAPAMLFALASAALAEAAADTASSEIGQVLGGRPRMITSFKAVDPGHDGAISLAGSLAGVIAAAIVAYAGMWALGGGWSLFAVSCAGAVFGLFFDSFLGATLEERGWLNNDAVNFLSTASAAGFALAMLCAMH
ncbi:MAG: DUF92 domain-containing protein [Terracidiphilus sp.]|nr:DUF92 domain-containing protein [Terracidiphilus sp.]MDR3798728.1 DUF92 domain-containing protein [Terracidiphilus sp.]